MERPADPLFNLLTGYSKYTEWQYLGVAPVNLRQRFKELIAREAEIAVAGGEARIIAKLNALSDPSMVRALYRASMAGVKIELIVRGICTLRPGIPGVSETIRVRSILDRFLEHSRVFYFHNAGNSEYYISSADWMPRNLNRRIEMLFPVLDVKVQGQLKEVLDLYLQSYSHARFLQPDGSYVRPEGYRKEESFRVQQVLLRKARKRK